MHAYKNYVDFMSCYTTKNALTYLPLLRHDVSI